MRLDHAIKRAQALSQQLKAEDAVAVHVLVELAKRVRRVQKPLRQLEKALCPEEGHLNQEELFSE